MKTAHRAITIAIVPAAVMMITTPSDCEAAPQPFQRKSTPPFFIEVWYFYDW
jgi:hypothetical protein